MASYETRKATRDGKAQTVQRHTARAIKYEGAARTTHAGRAR